MLQLMRVRHWLVRSHRLKVAGGALALASLFSGCLQKPRARSIVAPDGSPALHISCGSDQGACFELAGEKCPNGYRFKPIFDPASNNFLVRCDDRTRTEGPAAVATVVIRAIGPDPSASASAPPWPPSGQPWTPANPWPPGSVAAPSSGLPETARLPNGQIDIGY